MCQEPFASQIRMLTPALSPAAKANALALAGLVSDRDKSTIESRTKVAASGIQ